MIKRVLITGVLGGIGQGLASTFQKAGYEVTGLDIRNEQAPNCDRLIQFDLHLFCNDETYRAEKKAEIDNVLPGLDVLINNAAVQILGSLSELRLEDWKMTQDVNVTGPLLLSQFFLDRLIEAKGSIINIASIHQQLTKKRFLSYATSKGAMVALTRALSVDLQGKVRVNAISPAAIDTQMLRDGFNNEEAKVQQLNDIHPSQRIGRPDEVAQLALVLAESRLGFINGANIQIDGGISNVLKDLD